MSELKFNIIYDNIYTNNINYRHVRNASKWYPGVEQMKTFERPVMFVPEEVSDWKVENWNSNPQPIEREVKNMTINFGPQHPAAHGVLRLVLELAGEVKLVGCKN